MTDSAPESVRALLAQIEADLARQDLHAALAVPPDAGPAAVNAAYLRRVRVLHPDRLASLGLSELRPVAERVVAQLGEAKARLCDPAQSGVQPRAGQTGASADFARAIVAAEAAYRRGEGNLTRGDFAGAVAAFSEAVEHHPAEPQYCAYLVWARFAAPGARKAELASETLTVLAEVIRERPQFARAHHFAGLVHKHRGHAEAARKSFVAALALDPQLFDAERELRLLAMRAGRVSPAPGAPQAGWGARLARLFRR